MPSAHEPMRSYFPHGSNEIQEKEVVASIPISCNIDTLVINYIYQNTASTLNDCIDCFFFHIIFTFFLMINLTIKVEYEFTLIRIIKTNFFGSLTG